MGPIAHEEARTGPEPRRAFLVALAIYALTTALFFLTTAPERLHGHTPFNHFALLADAWVHGRLDLGHPPPRTPATTTSRPTEPAGSSASPPSPPS